MIAEIRKLGNHIILAAPVIVTESMEKVVRTPLLTTNQLLICGTSIISFWVLVRIVIARRAVVSDKPVDIITVTEADKPVSRINNTQPPSRPTGSVSTVEQAPVSSGASIRGLEHFTNVPIHGPAIELDLTRQTSFQGPGPLIQTAVPVIEQIATQGASREATQIDLAHDNVDEKEFDTANDSESDSELIPPQIQEFIQDVLYAKGFVPRPDEEVHCGQGFLQVSVQELKSTHECFDDADCIPIGDIRGMTSYVPVPPSIYEHAQRFMQRHVPRLNNKAPYDVFTRNPSSEPFIERGVQDLSHVVPLAPGYASGGFSVFDSARLKNIAIPPALTDNTSNIAVIDDLLKDRFSLGSVQLFDYLTQNSGKISALSHHNGQLIVTLRQVYQNRLIGDSCTIAQGVQYKRLSDFLDVAVFTTEELRTFSAYLRVLLPGLKATLTPSELETLSVVKGLNHSIDMNYVPLYEFEQLTARLLNMGTLVNKTGSLILQTTSRPGSVVESSLAVTPFLSNPNTFSRVFLSPTIPRYMNVNMLSMTDAAVTDATTAINAADRAINTALAATTTNAETVAKAEEAADAADRAINAVININTIFESDLTIISNNYISTKDSLATTKIVIGLAVDVVRGSPDASAKTAAIHAFNNDPFLQASLKSLRELSMPPVIENISITDVFIKSNIGAIWKDIVSNFDYRAMVACKKRSQLVINSVESGAHLPYTRLKLREHISHLELFPEHVTVSGNYYSVPTDNGVFRVLVPRFPAHNIRASIIEKTTTNKPNCALESFDNIDFLIIQLIWVFNNLMTLLSAITLLEVFYLIISHTYTTINLCIIFVKVFVLKFWAFWITSLQLVNILLNSTFAPTLIFHFSTTICIYIILVLPFILIPLLIIAYFDRIGIVCRPYLWLLRVASYF